MAKTKPQKEVKEVKLPDGESAKLLKAGRGKVVMQSSASYEPTRAKHFGLGESIKAFRHGR